MIPFFSDFPSRHVQKFLERFPVTSETSYGKWDRDETYERPLIGTSIDIQEFHRIGSLVIIGLDAFEVFAAATATIPSRTRCPIRIVASAYIPDDAQ
jgi:hypothetical protein